MRIRAWLSADAEARVRGDPWLSALDWWFCGGADFAVGGKQDLWLTNLADAPAELFEQWEGDKPLWVFSSGRPAPWLATPNIHFLRGDFDADLLRNRLLAWHWQQHALCPCLFGAAAFDIINGAMSLYRPSKQATVRMFPLEVSVKPVEAVGGDVVLRADLPERTLLILGDASGHGQGSALDAALLALGASRVLLGQPLSLPALSELNAFMYRHVADGRYVGSALLEIDWDACEVRLVNAGMPDILLFLSTRLERRFSSMCSPLGLRADVELRQPLALPWAEGQHFLAHSDGMEESDLPYLLSRLLRLSSVSSADAYGYGPLPSIPLGFSSPYNDDMSSLAFAVPSAASPRPV
ncbi:SpoIIE family protein phosphatase [Chromobacterium haemolyticum]|uniref:SpoIIE family protein phosphatase n=1 Tax=Chromobacterium haemolyticum TaxID=394935 RepID=UPI0011314558|nr:SpoIIE family protein phosphatase [Chromobacterium haemolyticum]